MDMVEEVAVVMAKWFGTSDNFVIRPIAFSHRI